MPRKAEIIAVGTELLLGNIINSNAQEISQALAGLGIGVYWHTVVGDNPERLRDVLKIASRRADIIITIGGLGPTYDDLTKNIISEFFNKNLIFHPEILNIIQNEFEKNRGMKMPENNIQQAYLPEDCVIFHNPVGTAPGCAFEFDINNINIINNQENNNNKKYVLMLPGPPFEMREMLKNYAVPYLRKLSGQVIFSRDIMTFGAGESAIELLLREEMRNMSNPTLATYAKPSEVRLRATVRAENMQKARNMLEPVVNSVQAKLGDIIYGIDVNNLEQVCVDLLKSKKFTLSTAESCTGGRIAERLTAIPGVSGVYKGGAVTYWTEMKHKILNISQEILNQYGAVSEQTAREMARGVCELTESDVAISVTGVAGPDPDERGVPVGIVYIGLATPDGIFCRALRFGKRPRDLIRDLAANHAFDLLRRYLSDLPLEIPEI